MYGIDILCGILNVHFEILHKRFRLHIKMYCQTSNISHTIVGNKFLDHTNVVGALPVSFAPTTFSFSNLRLASLEWAEIIARPDKKHLSIGVMCGLY